MNRIIKNLVALTLLIIVLSSCAKFQAKRKIQGNWTVEVIQIEDASYYLANHNSIIWTFDKKTVQITYLEDYDGIVESGTGTYKIIDKAKVLLINDEEWEIVELTSVELIIQRTIDGQNFQLTLHNADVYSII